MGIWIYFTEKGSPQRNINKEISYALNVLFLSKNMNKSHKVDF